MSGNSESTSNIFTPMPMTALIANLAPLQTCDSADSSYTSADESDTSIGNTVTKKATPSKNSTKKELSKSTPKDSKEMKTFTSEKIFFRSHQNKENRSYDNRTYPHKDVQILENQSARNNIINAYPNSDLKKRSVLMLHNSKAKIELTHKRTPEVLTSAQKSKIVTPKIKSGIRKFTPGSVRQSQKKTPQKSLIEQNKQSIRCLFPEPNDLPKEQPSCLQPPSCPQPPPQHLPVPETPQNRKPMPASYVATPSYPQGIIGNNSKIQFKTIKIKERKYMYIKKLGTGGSSEVYKVLEMGSSCEYAIKFVDMATDPELARGYMNEVRLLRDLQNSDRVIRLYDYQYDQANQYLRMVLEVGETDLSSFMRARGAGLPPALVLHYWEEMLQAVNYIHEHGVVHADLKPANFLLVCGRLKLIDFGIASAISSDATSVVRPQAAGTYSYISPEALRGGAGGLSISGQQGMAGDDDAPIKISYRSDVWSLGCILYSMVYGRTPFAHIPNFAKLAAILDPNHRIDYPTVEHLPPSLIAALKWCLTYNARARPFVRELLSIRYLQPAGASLPSSLLDKLRAHVTPQEYALLQQAQL